MKENELGGAFGTYWREQRSIKGFGGVSWKRDTTWKTQA